MEDNKESNETTCRICGDRKTRICIGKFISKNKKYTDKTGKLWSGLRCPDCHRTIQHNLQIERRRKRKCLILKTDCSN